MSDWAKIKANKQVISGSFQSTQRWLLCENIGFRNYFLSRHSVTIKQFTKLEQENNAKVGFIKWPIAGKRDHYINPK